MVKISALPPMTSPDGDDEAPIVDDSTTSTKKFSLTLLKEWFQSLAGWIKTAMIEDGAVTPDKLAIGPTDGYVATSQTTSSGSYTDLATVGPSATVTIGQNGLALVSIYASLDSGTVGNRPNMAFEMSGANTASANAAMSIQGVAASGATQQRFGATFLLTGLNPGDTTFTAKYQRASGTGDSIFANRRIVVVPL